MHELERSQQHVYRGVCHGSQGEVQTCQISQEAKTFQRVGPGNHSLVVTLCPSEHMAA